MNYKKPDDDYEDFHDKYDHEKHDHDKHDHEWDMGDKKHFMPGWPMHYQFPMMYQCPFGHKCPFMHFPMPYEGKRDEEDTDARPYGHNPPHHFPHFPHYQHHYYPPYYYSPYYLPPWLYFLSNIY